MDDQRLHQKMIEDGNKPAKRADQHSLAFEFRQSLIEQGWRPCGAVAGELSALAGEMGIERLAELARRLENGDG